MTGTRPMRPALERRVDLPAGRYRYLEWGDPSRATVVLLHGRTGAVETWEEIGERLSTDFHVLALEQRGHGESPWSAEGSYNLADFLADYEDFAAAVIGGPHALVGHSMGACTTLVYAWRHPELVTALVMEDGGPPGPTVKAAVESASTEWPLSFASWGLGRDAIHRASPHLVGAELDRRTDISLRPARGGRYAWKADIEGLLGEGHRTGDTLFDEGQWDAVAALTTPTLLLRADVPPCLLDHSVIERIRELNPRVRIVHKPTTHEMHEEIPVEFADDVRRHVREALTASQPTAADDAQELA